MAKVFDAVKATAPTIRAVSNAEDLDLRESRLICSTYGLDVDGDSDDGSDRAGIAAVAEADEAKQGPDDRLLRERFRQGEKETILRVLAETEAIALKRTSEGFNEVNFTLGVVDCFLISYMVGAYPQHLWLLYFVQSTYMIPRKFYNMWRARPLNEALYYLDFCWCMNFLAIFTLAVFFLAEIVGIDITEDVRRLMFQASVGISAVLIGANMALSFVACVFHDVNTMTGLFIHFMSPLVMYTFMWHSDAIVESWPTVFSFSYMDTIQYYGGTNSVVGCSTALYFAWWIFYVSFMLLIGIDLPKKYKANGDEAHPRWDTVFHSTMRGGACIAIGKACRGRTREESLQLMEDNNFDRTDFLVYMAAHMVASLAAIYTLGYGLFANPHVHKGVLAVALVLAVVRGAKRYTYYGTKMYSRTLRKQFAHIIAGEGDKEGYSRMN